MTQQLVYAGAAEPYFEVAVTGRQRSWYRNQVQDVPDATALLLLGAGAGFSVYLGGPLSSSDTAAVKGLVSRAGNQLLTGAATGATTGWIGALGSPERFAVQPTGISGTASITIDASADGATAAVTLGVLSLTSADNGKSNYTPPLSVGYPYVRLTVTADGGGTHNIVTGA